MKYLKTFESINEELISNENQFETVLDDHHVSTHYPDATIDIVNVKKCVIYWNLETEEDSTGINKFIPVVKKVDLLLDIIYYVNVNDDEETYNKIENITLTGNQIKVSEIIDKLSIPFKPYSAELYLKNKPKIEIEFENYE